MYRKTFALLVVLALLVSQLSFLELGFVPCVKAATPSAWTTTVQLMLSSDGTWLNWTPSSAVAHYTLLDETEAAPDTGNYIFTSSSTYVNDSWNFADLTIGSFPTDYHVNVTAAFYASKATGTCNFYGMCIIGGTQYSSSLSLGTSWGWLYKTWTADPATGLNWTVEAINAMQIGVRGKVTTAAYEYVAAAYVNVTYGWSPEAETTNQQFLWCDGFNNTSAYQTMVGASPYESVVDWNTNYFNTSNATGTVSWFSFDNTTFSFVTGVYFEFRAYLNAIGYANFTFSDGQNTTIYKFTIGAVDNSVWKWHTINITDWVAGSSARVNATIVKFLLTQYALNDTYDCFRLNVTFSDIVSPTYSDVGVTTNGALQPCTFYVKWTDETELATTGGYIFGTNNTGSWVNETWTAFTTNPDWGNCTKTLNIAIEVRVEWEVWANDTSNNWNNTGIQYLITENVTSLIYQIKTIVNSKVNWAESIDTAYTGYSLGVKSLSDLQTAFDSLSTTYDVIMWASILRKYSVDVETKVKTALDNHVIMANGLPFSWVYFGKDCFSVQQRHLLMGYYFAELYSYQTVKWNKTKAYENFKWAIDHTYYPEVYCIYFDNDTAYLASRFYDEAAETMDCFVTFYSELGITGALTEAVETWDWINNNLWMGDYYKYSLVQTGWECSGGGFLELATKLWYEDPLIGNISRVQTDAENRFLGSMWGSHQWRTSDAGTIYYCVIHHNPSNDQRRLGETLMSWAAIMGIYSKYNDTIKQNVIGMLEGCAEYPDPAWKYLLEDSTLYDPGGMLFKWVSDTSYTNYATAKGVALLMMLGIVPQTASLAIPLEEWTYEYGAYTSDGDLFRINLTTRTVRISVLYSGTVKFIYNTPLTETFSSSGVWDVTFNTYWNATTSVIRISDLPSTRKYLTKVTVLNVGWNNFTAWGEDVGKTLEKACANIQYNGIDSTIVIKNNGTLYRYDYGYETNYAVTFLATSDEMQVYCTTSGYWTHDYSHFKYRISPSRAVTTTWTVVGYRGIKVEVSRTFVLSWNVLCSRVASISLTQTIGSSWNAIVGFARSTNLVYSITSSWSVAEYWFANVGMSQSIVSSWNVLNGWAASVPLSQTVGTSWNTVVHFVFNINLAQPISSSWNILSHWITSVGLSQNMYVVSAPVQTYESQEVQDGTLFAVYETNWYAQTFTANQTYSVESICLFLEKYVGTPSGTIIVGITATSGGLPIGQELFNGTLVASSVSSAGWYQITMSYSSGQFLTPSQQYAIVVRDPNDNVSNCIAWFADSLSQFQGGAYYSSDGGTSWVPAS